MKSDQESTQVEQLDVISNILAAAGMTLETRLEANQRLASLLLKVATAQNGILPSEALRAYESLCYPDES
jgi:hypothetical protein